MVEITVSNSLDEEEKVEPKTIQFATLDPQTYEI